MEKLKVKCKFKAGTPTWPPGVNNMGYTVALRATLRARAI